MVCAFRTDSLRSPERPKQHVATLGKLAASHATGHQCLLWADTPDGLRGRVPSAAGSRQVGFRRGLVHVGERHETANVGGMAPRRQRPVKARTEVPAYSRMLARMPALLPGAAIRLQDSAYGVCGFEAPCVAARTVVPCILTDCMDMVGTTKRSADSWTAALAPRPAAPVPVPAPAQH